MSSQIKDIKQIKRFPLYRLGHVPGVGFWCTGVSRGSKIIISNMVMYRDDAIKIFTIGSTGDLGVRSKGQMSLNFSYRFLYQTLFVFSQTIDR